MDIQERKATPGKFRIIGYDQNDYTYHFVDELDDIDKAMEAMEAKRSVPTATPTSMSNIFYLYNDEGKAMYRASYDGGVEKL